ncbi:MAG: hypothetical protein ABL885_00515 [Methylophilaceae bacterium]
MALTLTVPALEENPLIVAETRPRHVTQFVCDLPFGRPLEAAILMREEIEILNRQKVGADARFKAMEIYQPALFNLKETLAIQYCNEPSPLSKHAKEFAAAAESLLLELSYGYKLALIDQQNKLISLSSSKSKAILVQRAVEALGQLAMVYYQTYFSVPASVWSDLHQLYFYAVQHELQDINLASDSEDRINTISLIYKQVLLLSLTYPQHLATSDMKFVVEYVKQYAHLAQLIDLAPLTNSAGVFLVRLNSKEPPVPYLKVAKQTNASSDILLVTVELARLLHDQMQMLQTGNLSALTDLPDNPAGLRHLDLLTYLIKHWGISPQRGFNREHKTDGIEVGIGLSAAHYLINQEGQLGSELDQKVTLPSENKAANGLTSAITSRWQVLNISATGLALRKLPNSAAAVRVGELFAIKLGEASHWSIGVLRWVNNNDKQQLDIGAELIAPEAQSVRIRAVGLYEYEQALLLPELPALNQAASIITACGVYSPAREMDLNFSSKNSRIMLTKLIERTNGFERFQFSNV